MVLSEEYGYLFIEVPSTGSTAISAELTEHYGGETILRKHANYTEFRKFIGINVRNYFVFATVRNPLDLEVTQYLKLKGNHKAQFTTPKFFERNGGFVPDQQLREFAYIRDHGADFASFFLQFRRTVYHNWFLVGQTNFDYIMRYEQLAEEFARVLALIGLEPVRPLPKVNPTTLKDRHFEAFYTPEAVENARIYYGPFMAKWGYEFPRKWSGGKVPWSNRVRFQLKEGAVNLAARFLTLSPFSPIVQRVKAIADALL